MALLTTQMVAKQVEKAPYTNRGDDSHGDSQPNIDVILEVALN